MNRDDLFSAAEAAVGEAAHLLAEYHRSRSEDRMAFLNLAADELGTASAAIDSIRRRDLLL